MACNTDSCIFDPTALTYRSGDGANDLLRKILLNLYSISQSSAPAPAGSASSYRTGPDFTVTVAGTRVQGANIATPRGVLLSCPLVNSSVCYVGDVAVSNNTSGNTHGLVLGPGGMTPVVLMVSNLNEIYVNADAANDRVCVLIL